MRTIIIRNLGLQPYADVLKAMQDFTLSRVDCSLDEIWFVEHPPVFTLGLNGNRSFIYEMTDIPVIKSDRGGQVTYHGPGQIIMYCLFNLPRFPLNVKPFTTLLEQSIIDLLLQFQIDSQRKNNAPGVYVNEKKIASLGLRIKKGCSYHGLSFNVAMDLKPFEKIAPCGYPSLTMTQCTALGMPNDITLLTRGLLNTTLNLLEAICPIELFEKKELPKQLESPSR